VLIAVVVAVGVVGVDAFVDVVFGVVASAVAAA
jgi:hypothetical protein